MLRDVLEWTHQRLAETLFSIAYDPLLTPASAWKTRPQGRPVVPGRQHRLPDGRGRGRRQLWSQRADGADPQFLDDWAQAFAQLYRPAFDEAQALERGRQLVADFEGAILLARIYGEPGYIDGVTRRALEQLAG